jgi:ribonucleoside-diphosphate reductase alpha chain
MMKRSTATPLVGRYFTQDSVGDPFDLVKWVKRDAKIDDASGKVYFEQTGMEFPEGWSQQAVNIVASKYFKGPQGTDRRENSVKQLINRVVNTIAAAGYENGCLLHGEVDCFRDELKHLLVTQKACFNSPVWFNVGVKDEVSHGYCWYGRTTGNKQLGTALGPRPVKSDEHKPQTSACFITSPQDDMVSILEWVKTEGMIFKGGSGSGANVSNIRSKREFLTSGSHPSGPLPFMQIADTAAGSISSGGKHRRAAKMVELNSEHPDIFEFVESKRNEEIKIRKLVEAGFRNDYNDPAGAQAAAFYQNENHSVSADDSFMIAVEHDADYSTKAVTTGKVVETFKARKLMRAIAEATHACGDPGMQFRYTMNLMHVAAGTAPIRGSNPCSEFMFIDNSSCNLASLNLMQFLLPDGSFDMVSFRKAVHFMIVAQEILVDMGSYPSEEICQNSHDLRPLGLGYANLGAYIMSLGLAYDSDEARDLAAGITAIMTGQAYLTSCTIAERLGPFPLWEENEHSALNVIHQHLDSVANLKPGPVRNEASELWKLVLRFAGKSGFRNAQTTVIAPTGTIGFMMDVDTTGIEPELSLIKYKYLVGGGTMKIVNQTVEMALKRLGWGADNIESILEYIDQNGTLEGHKLASEGQLQVFDCALPSGPSGRSIHYMGHVKMMAAVQPFLSGAISKTVNMPNSATVEDIEAAYMQAWKLGLKAIAIYRDGSKNMQPVTTKKTGDAKIATMGNVKDVYSEGLTVGMQMGQKMVLTNEVLASKLAEMIQTGTGRDWLEAHGLIEASKLSMERMSLLNGLGLGKVEKPTPGRRKMPTTRSSLCHKFDIAGHQGYLHVGLYEDGAPGEIFVTMSKEGSTMAGLMGNFSLMTSLALQYGVPLLTLVEKFSHVKYEPAGITKDPDIRFADSVVDYIFRWLEKEFLKPKLPFVENKYDVSIGKALLAKTAETLARVPGVVDVGMVHDEFVVVRPDASDAPLCTSCGSLMVRNGSCFKCGNCGGTSGCS